LHTFSVENDTSPSSWVRWHADYDDPGTDLAQRLTVVQTRLRQALDVAGSGHIGLISVCAGQGRDVIGGLAGHPRRQDVTALLVELDDRNALVARTAAADAGLAGVQVVRADASNTTVYRDAVPAQLLLLCGIFGNVTDDDVQTTVANASRLCAPEATVIWTRHRRPPDVTSAIRGWFSEAGFEEIAFDSPGKDRFAVGTCRLVSEPLPYRANLRLFTFR
jgi:hypothetical protein